MDATVTGKVTEKDGKKWISDAGRSKSSNDCAKPARHQTPPVKGGVFC